MKTKKTQAKKLVKPKPVVKAATKSASKKTVAAKKPAPARTGLIKKLQNALKGKSAAKAAKPATAAKKKPTPAKPAARPTPKKVAKPLAGKAKVPNKGKPQKTAVAASTVTKPAAKSKPVAAPKPARTAAKRIVRPVGSVLSEDDIREMSDDDYMDDAQLNFFRLRLIQMREEVLQREMDVKERLHEREVFADPADRATAEEEHWLDLRLRERESLLLKKIDEALRRIEAKEYGYCEKTGDPIGIPRLLARPTATVCVDVKGQDERVEAQFRDR